MAEQFGSAGTPKWMPMSPTPYVAKAVGQRGQAETKAAQADTSIPEFGAVGSSSILRYPENVGVGSDQGHWIIFEIYQQDPAQLKAQKFKKAAISKLAAAQAAIELQQTGQDFYGDVSTAAVKKFVAGKHTGPNSIQVKRAQTRRLPTSIGLYMPPSVSVTYGAKYADQDIGRLAETGASVFEAFMSASGIAEAVGGAAAATALGGLGGGFQTLFNKLSPAGAKTMAEISMGAIISPRMELMFEGINRRNFSFAFTFVPKNSTESDTVRKIVNKFKFHMASDYGNPLAEAGAGTFGGAANYLGGADGVRNMTIPDFFEIHYMYKNGVNSYLNKIKQCVLQTMNVSYGDDRYKSYADGAPQTTKLSLTFQELEIITKTYIGQGY